MGLMKAAWRELWQRNRGGGLLSLALWFFVLNFFYEFFVYSRLGPSLPKAMTNFLTHPGTQTTLPHLSPDLWTKLALVDLTWFLIVVPFALGGLYGGTAHAVKTRPQATGFLAFFRFGYENFWRTLTQTVLVILFILVLFGFLSGLSVLASAGGGMASVIFLILALAVIVGMVGFVLFWYGYTFMTDERPASGFRPALRWALSHLGLLYSRTLLLLGILIATLLVMNLIAAIPVVGGIVAVIVVGMIVPAFLAVYALLSFATANPGR